MKIPYIIAPRLEGDIAECYADAGKAKELLGWKAEKHYLQLPRLLEMAENNPDGSETDK